MKHFLFIFSLLFITLSVTSQNPLSEYSYIVVPQQFEFQKGKDQHRVNSLVRHLFHEAGFNPIYEPELKGLSRCSGLYTDLLYDSSFFRTKITILIKDCNNVEVYRSQTGSSKEKEHKKAYHEAIREAFRSLEVLGINQGDLDAFRERESKKDAAISSSTHVVEVKNFEDVGTPNGSSRMLQTYSHNNTSYQLESLKDGYALYEKRVDDYIKVGNLSKTTREGIYLFSGKDGKSVLANFDADRNLIIDGVDPNGEPQKNIYLRVKQY